MVSLLNFQDRDRIRAMAGKDPQFFQLIYSEIERLNQLEVAQQLEAITDPQVKQVTTDLLRDGLACWRGMFADPEFLASARDYTLNAVNHGLALLRERNVEDFDDPTTGLLFSAPGRLNDPDYTALPSQGRYRAQWNHHRQDIGHVSAQLVAQDPRVWSVITAASGREPVDRIIIAEKLVSSVDGQEWHIDKYSDQYKAMILLTDTDMLTGPLRFKLGSHRFDRPEKWKLMHDFHRLGDTYCNIANDVVRSMPGEVVYATGKAGDCFFFDSCAIHAGTRVIEGERLDFIIYPISGSLKTILVNHYLGG